MSDPGERTRATGSQRIAVIALATVLGGTTAGVAVIGSESLEPALTASAEAALHDAGVIGVGIRFDGREAVLTGEGADASVLAEAARVVERVDGVRWATITRTGTSSATPTPTPSPAPADPGRAAAIDELESTRILFAPDSAALDTSALRVVARVAVQLTAYPDLRIRLTGHVAIATGTSQDAVAFSERRAQAVIDELVAAGVELSRLERGGAGAEGIDDANDRRVDVEIVEAG